MSDNPIFDDMYTLAINLMYRFFVCLLQIQCAITLSSVNNYIGADYTSQTRPSSFALLIHSIDFDWYNLHLYQVPKRVEKFYKNCSCSVYRPSHGRITGDSSPSIPN